MVSFYHIGRSFWLKPYILFIALCYRACCLSYQIMVNCSSTTKWTKWTNPIFVSFSYRVWLWLEPYFLSHCHLVRFVTKLYFIVALQYVTKFILLLHSASANSASNTRQTTSQLRPKNTQCTTKTTIISPDSILNLATQNKSFTIKKPLLLACKFFTNLGPPLMCIPI